MRGRWPRSSVLRLRRSGQRRCAWQSHCFQPETPMIDRSLADVINPSMPTSDGAGVKLRRSLGAQRGLYVDPFLMLDEFYSDDPGDYLAGFPAHPHRGFETVTYMLDGHMRHEDHLGNRGDLGPGRRAVDDGGARDHPLRDAAAERGPHARIPALAQPAGEGKDEAGQLPGHPGARDPADEAAGRRRCAGYCRHLRDRWQGGPRTGQRRRRQAQHRSTRISTCVCRREPRSTPGSRPDTAPFSMPTKAARASARSRAARPLPHRAAGVLSDGESLRVQAGGEGVQFLLLAARPLREPVMQYGPFVMNTREEIEQAVADYREGRLGALA